MTCEKGSGAAEGINWEKERFLGDGPYMDVCGPPKPAFIGPRIAAFISRTIWYGMVFTLTFILLTLLLQSSVKQSLCFLFVFLLLFLGRWFSYLFYPYFKPNPFFMISHFSHIFKYIKMMLFFSFSFNRK